MTETEDTRSPPAPEGFGAVEEPAGLACRTWGAAVTASLAGLHRQWHADLDKATDPGTIGQKIAWGSGGGVWP